MREGEKGGGGAAAAPAFSLRRLVLPLYAPSFLVTAGLGAVAPVVPLFAGELGAGVGLASAIFALKGLGTLALDLPAGLVTARLGDKTVVVTGALGMTLAGALAATSGSLGQLVVAELVFGAGFAMWALAQLAFLAEMVPPSKRGRAASLAGGVNRVGMFVGPIVGGALGKAFGLPAAFAAQGAAALGAALCFALFMRPSRPDAPAPVRAGPRRLLALAAAHRRPLLGAGSVVVALQVLRASRVLLLTLHGDAVGLDVASIGLVIGASSGLDMLLFAPAGIAMDRYGRKWTAVPSLALMALALALLPLAAGFPGLLAVGLLAGLGNGVSAGLIMTLGADFAPEDARGEFLGVWRLAADLGSTAGPFAVGAVAGALGLGPAAFAIAAIGAAGAAGMAAFVSETRRAS